MKVTYICDICGEQQETQEVEDLEAEKLGISSLTSAEKKDIINFNEEQGFLMYTLCPVCFDEKMVEEEQE